MPSNYLVSEPVPSTPSYIRYGRGGAGNIVRASAKSSSTSASSPLLSSTSKPSPLRQHRFFSGRGGTGNAHEASERPAPSLEDEINRAAARDQALVGHCGIGGAGNVYLRKDSDASSSSTASSDSSATKFWARVSGTFGRD